MHAARCPTATLLRLAGRNSRRILASPIYSSQCCLDASAPRCRWAACTDTSRRPIFPRRDLTDGDSTKASSALGLCHTTPPVVARGPPASTARVARRFQTADSLLRRRQRQLAGITRPQSVQRAYARAYCSTCLGRYCKPARPTPASQRSGIGHVSLRRLPLIACVRVRIPSPPSRAQRSDIVYPFARLWNCVQGISGAARTCTLLLHERATSR